MSKWFVQLSTYHLRNVPRLEIKSQTLANFMADVCRDLQPEAKIEVHWLLDIEEPKNWMLSIYGASNSKGSGLQLY